MKSCIYCGSENLEKGIRASSDDSYKLGLRYRKMFISVGFEEIYADLCKDCGSISRFYVRDTNREWEREKSKED